jgi:hypothetical protein
MSTKIYNGIKFKSSNIKEVLDQLIQLKKVANKKAIEILKDGEIARFIMGNNLLSEVPFEISRELMHAINNSSSSLNRKWVLVPNLYFSVVVYPDSVGDIYGYYFISNRDEYYELLKPLYTDFHYQNQTDPPSELSEEEWDFRRSKWDELVNDKFGDAGFTYDLVTGDSIDIWDIESRVKSVIESLKREDKINTVLK